MKYFIRTFASFLVAFAIAFGLKYIGVEVTSFSLFFIVPIGAIMIGAIAGMGYPSAIESYNKKTNKVNTYIVMTLAVVAFVLLQFMYYKMTYLTADMSMNFHFEGEHISEFVVRDTNQPMTFINFLQLKIETSTISFTRRVVKPIFSVSGNSFLNYTFFIIDALGFFLGFYTSYGMLKSKKYCDDCNLYLSNKSMFKITDNFEEELKFLTSQIENGFDQEKVAIFKKFDTSTVALRDIYIDVSVDYCKECNDGELVFKVFNRNSKGKFIEKTDKVRSHKIDKTKIKTLLSDYDKYLDEQFA